MKIPDGVEIVPEYPADHRMIHHPSYLMMAYEAAKKSKFDRTQVGAVLVKPHTDDFNGGGNLDIGSHAGIVVAEDCNRMLDDSHPPNDRGVALTICEHAERSVLFRAIREEACSSRELQSCILYAPWFSCADCARAIIQMGIRTVIGHRQILEKTPLHWEKSVLSGMELMYKHGVRMIALDIPCLFPDLRPRFFIRFDNEDFYP